MVHKQVVFEASKYELENTGLVINTFASFINYLPFHSLWFSVVEWLRCGHGA